MNEKIETFIREYPGSTLGRIVYAVGLSEPFVEDIILRLKVDKKVTWVGEKYYWLEDFPDLAYDASLVYKRIREKPEQGVTIVRLHELTKYPVSVIKQEIKLLKQQKLVYETDDKFYPTFQPMPVGDTKNLALAVDFLTRDELLAVVKLFIQQTQWATETVESLASLVETRRNTPPKPKKETTGKSLSGISPDGTINLSF